VVRQRPDVRRKHGGKIAAVYNRKVLGVGKTYAAAWAAAQRRGLSAETRSAMVVVPYLPPTEVAPAKK